MTMRFPLMVFRVAERSMEPRVKEGSYAVVWGMGRVRSGHIVVLRHPRKEIWIVKRVAYSDGEGVKVLGDNIYESEDSRHFGMVSHKRVAGKVIFTI